MCTPPRWLTAIVSAIKSVKGAVPNNHPLIQCDLLSCDWAFIAEIFVCDNGLTFCNIGSQVHVSVCRGCIHNPRASFNAISFVNVGGCVVTTVLSVCKFKSLPSCVTKNIVQVNGHVSPGIFTLPPTFKGVPLLTVSCKNMTPLYLQVLAVSFFGGLP
eukprot:TRINITY_DN66617_c4_g9_i1.p2 TRINITY_DN66617_c4_g9~~TRINITY_DN66617_c4_g9_i1.p2  ORF type:complete len:158 (-),score=0.66 TRINITY_DN66617_c4_g9_i1:47-520(-)